MAVNWTQTTTWGPLTNPGELLTEVHSLEGGGLGMLIFLQRWARDQDIRLKLFNPSKSVRERLALVNSFSNFDIATLDEMMALLGSADSRYALAA